MRIFCLLFAFYVTALTIMPCNDVHAGKVASNIPLTIGQAQDHHERDNDVCSPFCTCTCCSVSVTFVAHFNNVSITPPGHEITFAALTQNPQSSAGDHWQPPKIA